MHYLVEAYHLQHSPTERIRSGCSYRTCFAGISPPCPPSPRLPSPHIWAQLPVPPLSPKRTLISFLVHQPARTLEAGIRKDREAVPCWPGTSRVLTRCDWYPLREPAAARSRTVSPGLRSSLNGLFPSQPHPQITALRCARVQPAQAVGEGSNLPVRHGGTEPRQPALAHGLQRLANVWPREAPPMAAKSLLVEDLIGH